MPNALAPAIADRPAAIELDGLDCYRVSRRGGFQTRPYDHIAEGSGRRPGRDRRRFCSIARGSVLECVAILDVMAGRAQLTLGDLRRGRCLLARVTAMLTKLGQR
jgi:hypothetical protein